MNSPIDQNELSKAQHALQSLKAKIGSAPRRPVINIGTGQGNRRFVPTFDIENQMMQRGPVHTNSNVPSQNMSLGGAYNSINNNDFNINRNAKPQFASPNYKASFNNVPKTTISNRRPVLAKSNFNNNFNNALNNVNINPNTNNYNANNYNYNPNNNYNNNTNDYNYNTNNYNSNTNNYNPNDERALDLNGGGIKEKELINVEQGEATYPCPDCGRNFAQAALEKHIKICKKVFQDKRKAFDSKATRITDPEQARLMRKGEMNEKRQARLNNNNKATNSNKEPKWKKQSEEFRNIIHGKASNVPSVLTDDYTLCQYCNRKYNEQAYNKHLEGCKRRFHEAQMKNKAKALQSNVGNNQGYYKGKYRK